MEKFLLFVIQEANFCSRVLVVPYEAYVAVREADYKTLKAHATKLERNDVTVENYLVQNVVRQDDHFVTENHPWTSAVSAILCRHAMGEGPNDTDAEWSNDAVILPSSSFDHFATYRKMMAHLRTLDSVTIVDSFLVVEARDGHVREPSCKDVKEMYAKFY